MVVLFRYVELCSLSCRILCCLWYFVRNIFLFYCSVARCSNPHIFYLFFYHKLGADDSPTVPECLQEKKIIVSEVFQWYALPAIHSLPIIWLSTDVSSFSGRCMGMGGTVSTDRSHISEATW